MTARALKAWHLLAGIVCAVTLPRLAVAESATPESTVENDPSPTDGVPAETAPELDLLVQAEQAFDQVDFPLALDLARRAVENGGRAHSQLTRLYELMALCSAALGENEDARTAYIRFLALNPDAQVDASLAPRIRAIFLDARGSWVARRGNLALEVSLLPSRGAVRLDLSDPLGLARTIAVRTRLEGDTEYAESTEVASAQTYVPVPGSEQGRVEYVVQALDEHGNHVIEEGSEIEPGIVGELVLAPTPLPPDTTPPDRDEPRPVVRRAWFWVVIAAAVVLVAGGGVATGLVLDDRSRGVGAETEVTIGIRQ